MVLMGERLPCDHVVDPYRAKMSHNRSRIMAGVYGNSLRQFVLLVLLLNNNTDAQKG